MSNDTNGQLGRVILETRFKRPLKAGLYDGDNTLWFSEDAHQIGWVAASVAGFETSDSESTRRMGYNEFLLRVEEKVDVCFKTGAMGCLASALLAIMIEARALPPALWETRESPNILEAFENWMMVPRLAALNAQLRKLGKRVLMPGVVEHLTETIQRGIMRGFYTSAHRRVSLATARLAFGEQQFNLVLPKEFRLFRQDLDETQLKPRALGWIKLAEALGVDPHETVVYDDSPATIRGAREAGFAVVGLVGKADRQRRIQEFHDSLRNFDQDSWALVRDFRDVTWRE